MSITPEVKTSGFHEDNMSLLNKDEFREFQDMVKYAGVISKELHKHNDAITKKKVSERNIADSIDKLTKSIDNSTEKLTSIIDSLISEIKKTRD